MENLEKQFDEAMFDIYRRADREIGYRPTFFLQMLTKDRGVLTAKKLINSASVSEGYKRLSEEGRLDLSVEAVVIDNPKWRQMFTDKELQRARRRLVQYGYLSRN